MSSIQIRSKSFIQITERVVLGGANIMLVGCPNELFDK